MHDMTKATSIPKSVKEAVYERDNGRCIICGAPGGPWCHIVRRSQGGVGTERNVVTLCGLCHYSLDEGLFLGRLKPLGLTTQRDVEGYVIGYIKGFYPDWTRESVTYHKWED